MPFFSATRRESVVATGTSCFGRQTLSPVVAAHVVADFNCVCALHILNRQATIADEFPIRLQHHCPEPVAIAGLAVKIASDPSFNAGGIQGRRIEAHGFWIREDES